MGVYVVTGGSSGIGAKAVELLKKKGHEVVTIDIRKCDLRADLCTLEGRQKAIETLHADYPEGIDGLICCAGLPGACGNLRKILSLNYFGTVAMVRGLYDLLKKKGGTCVITTSNTISQGNVRMDLADLLNNNSDDEERILKLTDRMDAASLTVCDTVYVASKYALARWMRRHSASYAANGVRLNAVAPGNSNTPMTATHSTNTRMALNALPIPTKYGTEELMDPQEIASVIVFLIGAEARGINGVVLFVDGGTDALLNSEKVY